LVFEELFAEKTVARRARSTKPQIPNPKRIPMMKMAKFKTAIGLVGCLFVASVCCRAEDDPIEIMFHAGKYPEALQAYQQELAQGKDAETSAHALFQSGQCLTGMKEYRDAVARFDELLTRYPFSSWADKALLRRGCVQAGVLKKHRAGIETWQELIKKYPQSDLLPEAAFYVGIVEWIDGHKQAARESWHILVLQYPQHPRTAQAKLYLGENKP
jgi:TolA-binding protein